MTKCRNYYAAVAKVRREVERLAKCARKVDQRAAYYTVLAFLSDLEAA